METGRQISIANARINELTPAELRREVVQYIRIGYALMPQMRVETRALLPEERRPVYLIGYGIGELTAGLLQINGIKRSPLAGMQRLEIERPNIAWSARTEKIDPAYLQLASFTYRKIRRGLPGEHLEALERYNDSVSLGVFAARRMYTDIV